MSRHEEPRITSNSTGQHFTRIMFKPDLAKFKMSRLDDDIVALFTKRVYDMAGVSDKRVSVYLDD